MLRTAVRAATAATLLLAAPPARADVVWTGSDSQTIVIRDGVVTGSASCQAAGAGAAGSRAVAVTVDVWDFRVIPLTVGCTLWQGTAAVFEITGSGKGAATARGASVIPDLPTRVCLWGTWTDQGHTVPWGSRDC